MFDSTISWVYHKLFPLLVVGLAFIIAWASTSISGMSDRETSTRYNSVVGKSEYEPPSWVFSVVWTVIYIGYFLVWTFLKFSNLPMETMSIINMYLFVGILLNILWSLFILYGSFDSFMSVKAAYWGSTITLVLIFVYNLYMVFRMATIIPRSWMMYLAVLLFVIYAGWAAVASFLSFTSPLSE